MAKIDTGQCVDAVRVLRRPQGGGVVTTVDLYRRPPSMRPRPLSMTSKPPNGVITTRLHSRPGRTTTGDLDRTKHHLRKFDLDALYQT